MSIDFWHSEAAANETALAALVDRFNSSQDEVKVRLLYQGSNEDINLKLLASLRSGDVPALVELDQNDFQVMVDSGAVTPIQEFIDAEGYDLSDFDKRAIDYYTADDKLYSMPMPVAVPLLFYNKIPFREVGLDPEKPPLTLDDVRAYSEKLFKVDGSGNVVRSGISLEILPWFLEQTMAEHGDLYVNNNNGRDGRATEAVFNNATGQAFFRWWGEMVKTGLAFNVGRNPTGRRRSSGRGFWAGRYGRRLLRGPALGAERAGGGDGGGGAGGGALPGRGRRHGQPRHRRSAASGS